MTITDFLPGFFVSLAAGATVYGFQKLTAKDPMRELAKQLSLPQPVHTPGDLAKKLKASGLVRKLNLGWED